MCLAIPGKVEAITGEDPITRMGRINFAGVIKEASLAYLPDARVGDYVLVHVGFALSKIDEEEANKVFGYLSQLGELNELAEAQFPSEAQRQKPPPNASPPPPIA
jgi:hydrogenase expression/formation protein HypC